MSYKNTMSFDPNKMGKKAGWCLMNCRLGFGINTGMRASAKEDWEKNIQHKDKNFPKGIYVPVYWDTASAYEHVTVTCGDGYHYSDGVRVKMWTSTPCFGWGELCDGRRVVEETTDSGNDTGPSTPDEMPARGYIQLNDNLPIVGRITAFMRKVFPAYTSANALGPIYGPYAQASIREFQRRTGLEVDGLIGPITLAKLKSYGFGG